ncbi:MAG TPA: efflux RND transporter permease subunit, partial [Verrucomicrobiae bacterium]|nr:efflux RND transporter permease subunit [Verrucomicrobiae bacterium]
LNYNLSVAVAVGMIALAGLDAETGVVMLLYLDHAWEKFRAQGRMATMGDLRLAVIEGAVQRIRPKIMTVCAILFGLLPIMWSPVTQAGADVMKRIAAPMIGGVVTSAVLELLLYPVIYVFWRRRSLPKETRDQMAVSSAIPTTPATVAGKKGNFLKTILALLVLAAIAAGAFFGWNQFHRQTSSSLTTGQTIATQIVNGLTITLSTPGGQLQNADNEVIIEFRDAGGQPVDVGTVRLELDMNMPGMVMHSAGAIKPTRTPGQYRAKIKPDMGGDWAAKLSYQGPKGSGEVNFTVAVKP